MKKITLIVLVALLSLGTINAQKSSDRTQMIGINPLGLVFNIYSGHYGIQINNKANEINVPFFFWAPSDDFKIMGIGARYRFYKDGNGVGFFYGGGVDLSSISWDYSWAGNGETATGVSITPKVEGGFRWAWDNGFTVAPAIELGYSLGGVSSTNGVDPLYGTSGFAWGLSLGLAYMF